VRTRIRLSLPALALLPLVAGALTAPAVSASTPPGPGRTVSFAGATVSVPADWPVVDVDGVPGCVRYDRHAVYLGTPSETDCPAGLVGRTSTVQITRAGSGTPGGDGAIVLAGPSAGARVVITTGGPDDPLAAEIVGSVRIDGSPARVLSPSRPDSPDAATSPVPAERPAVSTPAVPGAVPDASTPAATVVPAATFTGQGFDACSAPSLTQLDAWAVSPFGAVGVYVGGINRACAQPNLTPSWVSAVQDRGWHLIPTYVGLQAPCTTFTRRIDPAKAAQQGATAAADAAAQMSALGLGAGSPVYLDMESWDIQNAGCSTAVMTFTDAWTAGLHDAGYLSGFYSSANTGMVALVDAVRNRAGFNQPDAVWFARWDGIAKTGDTTLPDDLWATRQRIKQYRGPHDETYGGRRINIDSDYVNGPVTAAPVALSTAALPAMVPNREYTATLRARGGTPPYKFAVTSGALPAGLSLAAGGTISGTPTAVGLGSVTITVTDSSGNPGTASRTFPLVVTFTDVPTSNSFFDDIAWLANSGVTSGYPDGSFQPQAAVSRQAMAAFLYRYQNPGTPAPACQAAPFPDVPAASTFCPQIAWLAGQGITGGGADGMFHPTAAVTRQSMAAFLYRFAHPGADQPTCTEAPFPDVPVTNPFCGEIDWLANSGITGGYTDGTYRPTTVISRQSMAAFLHRLDQLPS
jgi:hypothetical protein